MTSWLSAVALAAGTLVMGAVVSAPWEVAADRAFLTAAQDTAAGRAIFTGKGNCHVCHGGDAKGTVLAPDLTDGEWINVDGSLESIVKVVKEGVLAPKQFPAPMPAMGGVTLTDAEVQAVSAYVHALGGGTRDGK